MTRLLVQITITLSYFLSLSRPVRRALTARTASKGSLPASARSRRAASVSTSSTKTYTNVSSSASSRSSIPSNVLLTILPLSPKNLLPRECAFNSTNLLRGYCFPRRIANFWERPRLVLVNFYSASVTLTEHTRSLFFQFPEDPKEESVCSS